MRNGVKVGQSTPSYCPIHWAKVQAIGTNPHLMPHMPKLGRVGHVIDRCIITSRTSGDTMLYGENVATPLATNLSKAFFKDIVNSFFNTVVKLATYSN